MTQSARGADFFLLLAPNWPYTEQLGHWSADQYCSPVHTWPPAHSPSGPLGFDFLPSFITESAGGGLTSRLSLRRNPPQAPSPLTPHQSLLIPHQPRPNHVRASRRK